METLIGRWCEFCLNRWQTATLIDYSIACVLIIVSGWLTSRLTSR